MRNYCIFIWRRLNSPHPRMLCAKIGWNCLSGSGEDDFLILSMYFHYFVIISSWKGWGPSFVQTWIPSTQGYIVTSLVEIGLVVLEKRIFKFVNVFWLFHNYLPLKKGWALHLKKLESSSPRDTLCQVWLKLDHSSRFWRRRFLNFINVFPIFCNYLSWEKGGALYLNKLESPSPKNALCQVWLKLAQWFWRRRFFNVGKGRGPSFEETWILFAQGYFVPNLVEIGPVVLEKKMKMWKVYRQTDGRTDNGRQVIRKVHLSFQLRWAENLIKYLSRILI